MTYYDNGLRAGVGTAGNTAGTTGSVGGSILFVGGANITLSESKNGAQATVTIIGGAGGGGGVAISAAGNSVSDGTVVFSNSNGLSFGMAGSTVTGSYTVPTVTNSSWTVSDAGTSGTVGRLAFTNLNGVTLSLSTGAGGSHTIVGSHNALTSQSNQNVTAANGGFAFQTLSFSNANGLSFGTSAGSAITGSYTVPTVPAQISVGDSNLGNTAGDTGVVTGRLVLVGTNGVTLSGSTNAGSMTISISAGGGGGNFSAGVSTGGNTAGATGITGTRLVFVGSDNITLSQTTDANGGTVSIVGAGGGAGQFSAGVSTGGNTAGSTGVTGTRLVFVGTGPVSLSQSTAAAGGTISIDAPATSSLSATGQVSISTNGSTISIGVPAAFTKSRFNPFMEAVGAEGQVGQATLHFHPIPDPDNFQFDRLLFDIRGTQNTQTNSTGTFTVSMWAGLYTRNVSTLSRLASSSTSQALTFSGTVNSTLINGPRLMSMGWTTTITQNDLWMGIVSRTTSGGVNLITLSQYLASDVNSNFSGMLGVATNATIQNVLGLGVYTTSTSGMPASVAFSEINGTASQFLRVPLYYFLSQTA